MTKERPLILVTNDDGIYAPGIRALVKAALKFGDVVVVAPDKPQSGMGHAITINSTLRVEEVHARMKVLEHGVAVAHLLIV
jgi:5'-nucleotidase